MSREDTSFIRKLTAKSHVLLRALRGNKDDQYAVVRSVVFRLPISDSAKKRLIAVALSRVIDRKHSTSVQRIQRAQQQWDERGHERLRKLLDNSETIECVASESPLISFILVLFNKAHLSLLTIESIIRQAGTSYEVLIVDNASSDETPAMLDRIRGARIFRNDSNIGFGPACMQAAARATGKYLCFFNNDALLTEGAMPAALQNFDSGRVGAVGGKILLANGQTQEAGSIVWRDASALGYGRGDDPELPQYNFRRTVDYCSAVFLVTPRELFHNLGGFSSAFSPAYYEDTDYCMTLWSNGYSVIYEPTAKILHYESASSGGNDFAIPLMASHQAIFKDKWQDVLARHYPADIHNVPLARFAAADSRPWILYIDDRVPERSLGAGFPRSNDILRELVSMGCRVTCATSTSPLMNQSYEDIPTEVELFDGFLHREELSKRYLDYVDIVWVSRPHNLKLLMELPGVTRPDRRFALVYDAEAIFAEREAARKQLQPANAKLSSGKQDDPTFEEELKLAKAADSVCVTSPRDKEVLIQHGVSSVNVISHRIAVLPTAATFAERSTFLFVGSVHGPENPNIDSLRFFHRTMWQQIHKRTGAVLEIAGYGTELLNLELQDSTVRILGPQADLRPVYERARVFIIPTRYAAGIPFKAHEAAGYGVPLVVSELIASQLNWQDQVDYYVGSDPAQFVEGCVRIYHDDQLWKSLRANALARVNAELSPQVFATSVRSVVEDICARGLAQRPRTNGVRAVNISSFQENRS